MKADYVLLAVAFMAVIVAVAGSFYTYNSIQIYKQTWLTGFATTGALYVNVTPQIIINFTSDSINFGTGRVTLGNVNATLDTSAGTVTGGNWNAVTSGFIVENQGNYNVSLQMRTTYSSTNIGGTNPYYAWNVSYSAPGNTTACLNASNGTSSSGASTYNLSVWTPVQTSNWLVCDKFQYRLNNNSVRIDVRLQVPRDASPQNFSDTYTATATAI